MLFWNFPARKQPFGVATEHPPPCVGPQGRRFTGRRSPGKPRTRAPWLRSSRLPSLSPLPLVMCFQSLSFLMLTRLRWAPGLQGCGVGLRPLKLGRVGAEGLMHQPLSAGAFSGSGVGVGSTLPWALGHRALQGLSGLCSRPGTEPEPAPHSGSAFECPTIRTCQPARGPVPLAGEPAPDGLRGGPEPGPGAHRPDCSLRASWSCCHCAHRCCQQLRGENSCSQASLGEDQERGGESRPSFLQGLAPVGGWVGGKPGASGLTSVPPST